MASSQFRFPFLDIGELVKQLPEIGLTEADFKNPKVERWQMLYTMLLEIIADVSPDQLMQHNFETTAHIEHPELFEDSMPLFKLCRYMQKIMSACDIDDFSMGDLTDPSCKRLQRNMSAILNFLYFRTDRLDKYEAIKEENSAQLKTRDAMLKSNMEIRTEINRIRSERAEQEPRNNELQRKIEELHQYLENMGEVTTQKKKALHETNERIAEKRSKLAEMKAKLAEAREQGARLSRQIVSSPDRLRENMERMGRQLEQLRVVKEDRRARLLELQQMKENLAQIETNCEQALDHVNKIKAEVEQQKEQRRQIQVMRDKLIEKRDELQDLEAKEQQVQRMIASKQEKFSKISLSQNNKKQSLENALQLLREEREIIRTQHTEDAAQKDALAQAQRAKDGEEQEDVVNHEKLMEAMQENYTALLEKLEIYHRNLMASRQKLCDVMEL